MEKLRARIEKLRVNVRHFNGKVLEISASKMDEYYEEESLMGVVDRIAFRTKFIDKTVQKITRQNKQEEERAREKRSTTMVKLLVKEIKVI